MSTLRPLIRRASLPVVPLVLLGLAVGCAGWKGTLPQEEGLHPRLSRWTYLERGELAAFAVDVEATLKRLDESVIPIGVGVANLGIDRITLTRESFTLVDPETGRRYAMASIQEVRNELGPKMSYDLRLSENYARSFAGTYQPWDRRQSVFFPTTQASGSTIFGNRALAIDVVELPKHSWMVDVLYFPKPREEIEGERFELWLDAEELEDPFFVKFAVK